MRRKDTQKIGREAEDLAALLLREHGFEVVNLNDRQPNYPLYDLAATRNGREIEVSVKCARAKRELRLGSPNQLVKLSDNCVVMALIPASKGVEISLNPGGYELLIIPGQTARDEALEAHNHYASSHPGSANHSVMVKDKIDRSPTTRSGAVFSSWHERFLNAWDIFDDLTN